MATEAPERRDRMSTAGAVDGEATVALEVFEGGRCIRTENAIDASTIETQPCEKCLKISHIVATKVGRYVVQDAIA
jgi:hypothetical protein